MIRRALYIAAGLLMLYSCRKAYTAEEYKKWITDPANGLHKIKTVKDMVFDVQYKPAEYEALLQSSSKIASDPDAYKSLQYIELKLSVKDLNTSILQYGLTTKEEMEGRLYYLSFPMQNDLFLIDSGDTLPCVMYHFIRSYDLHKDRTFMLGFPKGKNKESSKTFVFNSGEFNTGPVKIIFESQDLLNASKIHIGK